LGSTALYLVKINRFSLYLLGQFRLFDNVLGSLKSLAVVLSVAVALFKFNFELFLIWVYLRIRRFSGLKRKKRLTRLGMSLILSFIFSSSSS